MRTLELQGKRQLLVSADGLLTSTWIGVIWDMWGLEKSSKWPLLSMIRPTAAGMQQKYSLCIIVYRYTRVSIIKSNYCLELIEGTPSQKPLPAMLHCKQAVFIKSNKSRKRLLHNYYKMSHPPSTRSSGDRTFL